MILGDSNLTVTKASKSRNLEDGRKLSFSTKYIGNSGRMAALDVLLSVVNGRNNLKAVAQPQ